MEDKRFEQTPIADIFFADAIKSEPMSNLAPTTELLETDRPEKEVLPIFEDIVTPEDIQEIKDDEPKQWDFFDDADATSRNGLNITFQLKRFVKQSLEISSLSLDEEKKLIERLKDSRDTIAANQLFETNLRLVAVIAHDYLGQGISAQKLVKAGCEGLRQAIAHFEPTQKYGFRDYVQWPIRHFMLEALNSSVAIRLNINVARTILKNKNNLQDEPGDLSSLKIASNSFSANEVRLTMLSALNNYELSMSEKEIEILERRYGLTSEQPQTPWTVAKDLNLSLRQVYKYERSALHKFHNTCLSLSRFSPGSR